MDLAAGLRQDQSTGGPETARVQRQLRTCLYAAVLLNIQACCIAFAFLLHDIAAQACELSEPGCLPRSRRCLEQ